METSGRWRFAFVTPELARVGERPKVKIRGIADAPHSELVETNRIVRQYACSQSLIDAVATNMGEFCQAVVEQSVKFYQMRKLHPDELSEITVEYSRLLVNLLAVFRMFLDHTQTTITRCYGKKSQELVDWELATHREYDSVFGYRLVYGLRNYCLHVGMPPINVSFSATSGDPDISFSVNLLREILLDERSCLQKTLVADLVSRQTDIPLMQALDDWSKSFWRLAHVSLTTQRKGSLDAAQRVLAYRNQFGLPPNEGELCAILFPLGDQSPNMTLAVLHLEEGLCRKVVEGPTWTPETGA